MYQHPSYFCGEDSILAAGIPAAAALMSAGEGWAAKMQHLLLIGRPICEQLFCLVLYLYDNLNSNIDYVFVCFYVFKVIVIIPEVNYIFELLVVIHIIYEQVQ